MLIRIIRSGIWFSEMWNMKYLRKCFWNGTFSFWHILSSVRIELCNNVISNLVLSNDSRARTHARNPTLFVGQSKTFWKIFANLQSHVSNIANETSDSSSFADDLIGILFFFASSSSSALISLFRGVETKSNGNCGRRTFIHHCCCCYCCV